MFTVIKLYYVRVGIPDSTNAVFDIITYVYLQIKKKRNDINDKGRNMRCLRKNGQVHI